MGAWFYPPHSEESSPPWLTPDHIPHLNSAPFPHRCNVVSCFTWYGHFDQLFLQLTPLHFTIAGPWWLMSLHSDSESLTNIWLIIDHVNQAEARPRLGTGRSQLQQWLFSWTEIYAVYWEGTVKRRINLNQQVGGLFWCRSVSYFSLVWEWDRRALVQRLISLL